MSKYDIIYDFWFSKFKNPLKWLYGCSKYDDIVKDNLTEYYNKISLSDEGLKECLINVILLDQVSRHLFRGTFKAFDKDTISRKITIKNIKMLNNYNFEESIYFLMPLAHSEIISDKDKLIVLFEKMKESFPDKISKIERFILIIKERKKVLELFNRYPKRNNILNRKTNKLEQEYLQNNGKY